MRMNDRGRSAGTMRSASPVPAARPEADDDEQSRWSTCVPRPCHCGRQRRVSYHARALGRPETRGPHETSWRRRTSDRPIGAASAASIAPHACDGTWRRGLRLQLPPALAARWQWTMVRRAQEPEAGHSRTAGRSSFWRLCSRPWHVPRPIRSYLLG